MEDSTTNNNNKDDFGVPTSGQVYQLFKDIFDSKFASLDTDRTSLLQRLNNDNRYMHERRLSGQLTTLVFGWAFIATVGSFWSLRTIPGFISKQMAARRGVPYAPPIRMFGAFGYAFGIMFDVSLSLFIGNNTTRKMTELAKLEECVSRVPLVQGRSVLSEELCGDFIRAYDITKTRGFDWSNENHNSNTLTNIERFVKNCHARQNYEQDLRRSQGLSSEDPVTIPPPGVPQDYESSIALAGFETMDSMPSEQFGDTESWEQPPKTEEWSPMEEFKDEQEKKPKRSWWWSKKS